MQIALDGLLRALKIIQPELNFTDFESNLTTVFNSSSTDIAALIDQIDTVFDEHFDLEQYREIVFDVLLFHLLSNENNRFGEDFTNNEVWLNIEDNFLDHGTEALNFMTYLFEAKEEEVEVNIKDFIEEYLVPDEDFDQESYPIYEVLILNEALLELSLEEVCIQGDALAEGTELGDLLVPMLLVLKNAKNPERTFEILKSNSEMEAKYLPLTAMYYGLYLN